MYKYELIVKWSTGEATSDFFDTEEAAKRAAENLKRAFGGQVEWTGTIKKWTN
ncbi:MAG: hypothetical protein J5601_06770 [Elusimicrobiaceae bacterium]|nr:hypothetical protein [Elusimicrobiaceae bacterium]